MEKIIVKTISLQLETKTGDPFWGVELGDGRKATVWDAQIAADIALNLNWPTEADLKQTGNFLNIREFKGERVATSIPTPTAKEVQAPLNTGRFDNTPVEQAANFEVELKSSVKLTKNSKGINWEVKVVRGEESLIESIREAAVIQHNALEEIFGEEKKEELKKEESNCKTLKV